MQSAPCFSSSSLLQPLRLCSHPLRHVAVHRTPHRRKGMYSPRAGLEIQPPPTSGQGSAANGQVRVRQHVNPLARRWRQPVNLPPDWYSRAFADASQPLVLDVGVAKGRFLLRLAAKRPSCNFLGLEIREPLVHQANRAAAEAGLCNVFYVACNANVDLRAVLDGAPRAALTDVYLQFCDPWFKKRHAKRRMVNDALVEDIFAALERARVESSTSGMATLERRVFLQSDVIEVAEEMRDLFDEHDGFERMGAEHGLRQDGDDWLLDNPTGEPTEREITVQNKGGAVYRALFRVQAAA